MSDVSIRLAVPNDASVLAQLRYDFRSGIEAATEPEPDFVLRCATWMTARLSSPGAWRCWVAENAGRIVGTIWLQLIEKLPNPVEEAEQHAYITNLYVEPSARGVGLGTQLIATCLQACANEAVDAVVLWPTPRSRTLYKRHGFSVRDDLFEMRFSHAAWL